MDDTKIAELAAALRAAHGPRAAAEAASRRRACEAEGKSAEAETWRSIYNALNTLAAPHQG